jgi:hypothetical protein
MIPERILERLKLADHCEAAGADSSTPADGRVCLPTAIRGVLWLSGERFSYEAIRDTLSSILEHDPHAKRIKSLCDATLGVLHSGSLAICAIGQVLAAARSLKPKHAIKQVDRLLSNEAMLALISDHGRSTPLVWLTVDKSTLKVHRSLYEHRVLVRLAELVPAGIKVCIVADRGFGDQKLYKMLSEELYFDSSSAFAAT